jgi:hypothetical protein
VQEDYKAKVVYVFFNEILGTLATRSHVINLEDHDLPCMDLSRLGNKFTKEEVWRVIRSMPSDKALGPDGFTARFLQHTWDIIRLDLMRVFDSFWHMDTHSFHAINEALLTCDILA